MYGAHRFWALVVVLVLFVATNTGESSASSPVPQPVSILDILRESANRQGNAVLTGQLTPNPLPLTWLQIELGQSLEARQNKQICDALENDGVDRLIASVLKVSLDACPSSSVDLRSRRTWVRRSTSPSRLLGSLVLRGFL